MVALVDVVGVLVVDRRDEILERPTDPPVLGVVGVVDGPVDRGPVGLRPDLSLLRPQFTLIKL